MNNLAGRTRRAFGGGKRCQSLDQARAKTCGHQITGSVWRMFQPRMSKQDGCVGVNKQEARLIIASRRRGYQRGLSETARGGDSGGTIPDLIARKVAQLP